jgi:DNA-binding beta-propeller fold protein YncE
MKAQISAFSPCADPRRQTRNAGVRVAALKWNCGFALAVGLLFMSMSVPNAEAQDNAPLKLVQRIPMPNVQGRMDHLGVDIKGNRLFAAALGDNQNTVEVIDLKAGKRIFSIPGQSKPQGIFYSPDFDRLFVSNGDDGTYKVFRGDDLKPIYSVPLGTNPNHVGYDPGTKYLYVGFRDAMSGLLAIIDTQTGKNIADIRTDALPGGIKMEQAGSRIFVTLAGASKIGVVDRRKREQIATWPLARPVSALALDESRHRLFAGGRNPPKLVVIDTVSGKQIAELDCVSGIDDLWYDASRKRIYATGTDGIAVYDQTDADHYAPMVKVASAPNAATSIWVPAINRLYVSAPQGGTRDSEILVYEPQP